DQKSETGRREGVGEGGEARLAAQLLADAGGVDGVVSVAAAGGRPGDRRGVDVADAQLGEVAGDVRGGGEVEAAVELKPVGRPPLGHRCAPCPPATPATETSGGEAAGSAAQLSTRRRLPAGRPRSRS